MPLTNQIAILAAKRIDLLQEPCSGAILPLSVKNRTSPAVRPAGMNSLIRVSVPPFVSANFLEELHGKLCDSSAIEVEFDLSGFEGARLFAEARLLGLLVSLKRRYPKVRVEVPIKGNLSDCAPNDTSKYGRLFRSAIGLVVANFADSLPDQSFRNCIPSIRKSQAEELDSHHGLIVRPQNEVIAPLFQRIPSPLAAHFYQGRNISDFDTRFRGLICDDLGLPKLNDADFDAVTRFAFETVQNCLQHATRDLEGKPIHGMIFLSVRRIDLRKQSLANLIGDQTENPVSSYLQALERESRNSLIDPRDLIEITVADSGVGIPARMFGNMSIYTAARTLERNWLRDALTPTGTSKSPSIPGAGLGLHKVMEATYNLKGLILFRTGRMLQYKYYVGGTSSWPDVVPLDWEGVSTRPIAGTAVSLILPWTDQRPLALDFGKGAQTIR